MSERIVGAKRQRSRVIGSAVLAAALSLAGCGDLGPGDGKTGWESLEEHAVDCTQDSSAQIKEEVFPIKGMQMLGIRVLGPGYEDNWQLRVFPPNSDVFLHQQRTSEAYHIFRAQDIETGEPQIVKLPHGALGIQQTAPFEGPSSLPSPALGPRSSVREVLELSVYCEQPEGAAVPQPG